VLPTAARCEPQPHKQGPTVITASSPSCSLPMTMPLRRLMSPMTEPWNSVGAVTCREGATSSGRQKGG
jgi:hypothetical protein